MLRTQSARQQTGREQVKRDLTAADITVRRYQQRPSMSSSAANCPLKHECVTLGWTLTDTKHCLRPMQSETFKYQVPKERMSSA